MVIDETIHHNVSYCRENFDSETPFLPDGKIDDEFHKSNVPANGSQIASNCNKFYEETADSFAEFINELKTSGFCIIKLLFTWPQYVSKYWEQPLPSELRDVYLKIYRFYL